MMQEPEQTAVGDSPCVHCGLCLDMCPTYRMTAVEAESPRGRLYLMRAVDEGALAFDRTVAGYLDSCLGCLACESACPSGVHYGRRIHEFRAGIGRADVGIVRRGRRLLAGAAASPRGARLARKFASMLDLAGLERFRRRISGLSLMPRVTNQPAMAVVPPPATARLRVALLLGCVAHQIRPSIAAATVDVLHRNGIEVIPLSEDTCCGALALHSGDFDAAIRAATAMCRAVEKSRVDFVVTTAAGCGAMVRKFSELFLPQNTCFDAAVAVSRAARDISELLVEIGIRPPDLPRASERIVAYHDACHLLHGCGVHAQPRALLSGAGIRWRDLAESTICCGSAGVYNLLHPEAASRLGRRKAELIVASGASDVVVGNIGCMMQLELALSRENHRDIAVWHPVELLDAAYREKGLL